MPRSTRPDGSLHRSWSGKELQSPPNLNYAIQTKIEQQKAHLRRRNVGFLVGILSPASSSDWTGLALGLGIIPDCDERQDSDKNHDQTNRPPMSIWIFHFLLLGGAERGWAETVEPLLRGRFFLFTVRVPAALLLSANALDYESFFLGVNQIIP